VEYCEVFERLDVRDDGVTYTEFGGDGSTTADWEAQIDELERREALVSERAGASSVVGGMGWREGGEAERVGICEVEWEVGFSD
jgi:hypothetical protein